MTDLFALPLTMLGTVLILLPEAAVIPAAAFFFLFARSKSVTALIAGLAWLVYLPYERARISHQPSAAAPQWHDLTGFPSVGVLDVPSSTPARSSVGKARDLAPLRRLATNAGEKSGLAVKWRILCTGECNIRVDLLLIYPVLLLASLAGVIAYVLSRRKRRAASA